MEMKKAAALEEGLRHLRKKVDSTDVLQSIDIIIAYLHNSTTHEKHSNNTRSNACIMPLLDCVKRADIRKLKEENPNIDERIVRYIENRPLLKDLTSSDLLTFTVKELKLIYYIITEASDNHAMRSKKKGEVLSSVREAIAHYRRSDKLLLDK